MLMQLQLIQSYPREKVKLTQNVGFGNFVSRNSFVSRNTLWLSLKEEWLLVCEKLEFRQELILHAIKGRKALFKDTMGRPDGGEWLHFPLRISYFLCANKCWNYCVRCVVLSSTTTRSDLCISHLVRIQGYLLASDVKMCTRICLGGVLFI